MHVPSPALQALCCEIVEDHYGGFHRAMFERLAQQGRCTATQLAQRCHLSLRQVRAGLAALIDLRLVYHSTVSDAPTTYIANFREAYRLVRVGKLIDLAYEQHGNLAASIMEISCDSRFCTIAELHDRIMLQEGLQEKSLSGHAVRKVLSTLVTQGFLIHVRKGHFSALSDLRREVESRIGHVAMSRVTGVKAKAEHDLQLKDEIADLVNTERHEFGFWNTDPSSIKTNNVVHGQNGNVATESCNDDDTKRLVQPNFYKIVVHAQIACLQQVLDKTHGKKASAVLGVVLDHVANKHEWSENLPTFLTSKQIQTMFEEQGDRMRAQTEAAGQINGHSQPSLLLPTAREIDQHMSRLAEGPYTFLEEYGGGWQVDRQQLDKHIAKEELLKLMQSRLEHPGPRILRILIEKGKLEERSLQEMGLLGAKELRQSLAVMEQMGYLDLQEVPRNPQRQPNQTVFLWFHDYERVQQHLLESIYKGMTRMLQLLNLERDKISSTLIKTQRKDVRGREQQALGEAEYAVLLRFRRLEAWIWAELGRLDTSVAVLRDVPSLLIGPTGD